MGNSNFLGKGKKVIGRITFRKRKVVVGIVASFIIFLTGLKKPDLTDPNEYYQFMKGDKITTERILSDSEVSDSEILSIRSGASEENSRISIKELKEFKEQKKRQLESQKTRKIIDKALKKLDVDRQIDKALKSSDDSYLGKFYQLMDKILEETKQYAQDNPEFINNSLFLGIRILREMEKPVPRIVDFKEVLTPYDHLGTLKKLEPQAKESKAHLVRPIESQPKLIEGNDFENRLARQIREDRLRNLGRDVPRYESPRMRASSDFPKKSLGHGTTKSQTKQETIVSSAPTGILVEGFKSPLPRTRLHNPRAGLFSPTPMKLEAAKNSPASAPILEISKQLDVEYKQFVDQVNKLGINYKFDTNDFDVPKFLRLLIDPLDGTVTKKSIKETRSAIQAEMEGHVQNPERLPKKFALLVDLDLTISGPSPYIFADLKNLVGQDILTAQNQQITCEQSAYNAGVSIARQKHRFLAGYQNNGYESCRPRTPHEILHLVNLEDAKGFEKARMIAQVKQGFIDRVNQGFPGFEEKITEAYGIEFLNFDD